MTKQRVYVCLTINKGGVDTTNKITVYLCTTYYTKMNTALKMQTTILFTNTAYDKKDLLLDDATYMQRPMESCKR